MPALFHMKCAVWGVPNASERWTTVCLSVFPCSGCLTTLVDFPKFDSFQHPPIACAMGFGDHLVTHIVAPGAQRH